MNTEKLEMFATLINWFDALTNNETHYTAVDLCDGVAMAKALFKIAPDVFTKEWLSQIKVDTGANWRLKASNIRKLVDFLMDYYSDTLNLTLTNFSRIDVIKIAEIQDETEIARLLQLILGFAVNCPHKQEWIKQIMELEESLQQNIMNALQDLETAWQNGGTSSSRTSLILTKFDDKTTHEQDVLAQKCHEAERQIMLLLDEKLSLQQENAKIMRELDRLQKMSGVIGDDAISIGPVQPGSARFNELRRQLDTLKDDLLQAETARDDFKIKSKQQENEIIVLRVKVEELNQSATELAVLKDEIDVLREASEKLKMCETQIGIYKKKLEDYNDLKRQVKILEDRSADYYQQNVHQEENMKKISAFKSQIDIYKTDIEDLNSKLDAEIMKNVKTEFDLNNIQAKYTALQREKDSLLDERDLLRETCDELRCNQLSEESGNISKEMMPPVWKEQIQRLETENAALRAGVNGEGILSQYMDDANQRIEKLRDQLKQANQKILSLSQNQSDDNTNINSNLTVKQIDGNASEARDRKNVEKAKEIIKSFETKAIITIQDKLEGDDDVMQESQMGLMEEKLLTTAFYKLSMKCCYESVDARLAKLAGSGHSFLTRQRQPAARRPVNYKTK